MTFIELILYNEYTFELTASKQINNDMFTIPFKLIFNLPVLHESNLHLCCGAVMQR
jgi:hypothetical protein